MTIWKTPEQKEPERISVIDVMVMILWPFPERKTP